MDYLQTENIFRFRGQGFRGFDISLIIKELCKTESIFHRSWAVKHVVLGCKSIGFDR